MCFSPLYIIMYQYMYSIYIILHLQLLSPWMYNQTISFKISTQVQNKNLFAFDIVFNMYSIKSHRIFCRPELKAFMEHCTTSRSYSFCIKKMCWPQLLHLHETMLATRCLYAITSLSRPCTRYLRYFQLISIKIRR